MNTRFGQSTNEDDNENDIKRYNSTTFELDKCDIFYEFMRIDSLSTHDKNAFMHHTANR